MSDDLKQVSLKRVNAIVRLAVKSGCMVECEGIKVTPIPSLQTVEQKKTKVKVAPRAVPERKRKRTSDSHPIQELQSYTG